MLLDKYACRIKALVKVMAEDGVINAQSIYNELKQDGYKGSARSVRRYVTGLRPRHGKRRIYRPFEIPPGRQAMVDLGEKRQVPLGGRRQTVHVLSERYGEVDFNEAFYGFAQYCRKQSV